MTRVSEAVDTGDTIDSDEYLYRRVSAAQRDLNPITQDRAVRSATSCGGRTPSPSA